MKVGIVSMQRVYNYGSFLQAFALKSLLEERGHSVCFVDIENKCGYPKDKKSKTHTFVSKLKYCDKYFLRRAKDSKKNKQLNSVFKQQQRIYLDLKEYQMRTDCCETVVIGSDEIFNCSSESKWGITGQRFGKIQGVPNVLSYAASCGCTGIYNLEDEDRVVVQEALKYINNISVRDKNTYEFVKKMSDKDIDVNLDPVLIYDFTEQLEMGEKEGIPPIPYMIVYAYHNRIDSKQEIKAIKKYARKNELKTIAIGGSLPWCDEFVVLSPFQVLAYFKHASCIVTDTFHGTVFSAKLNKQLAILVRDSNKNKLGDLIDRLHIENHKVTDIKHLDTVLEYVDDYAQCNEIIKYEREHTQKYLESSGL